MLITYVMTPTITCSGTPASHHVDSRIKMLEVLDKAILALSGLYPNGRDYINDDDNLVLDISIHLSRLATLKGMKEAIRAEAETISAV